MRRSLLLATALFASACPRFDQKAGWFQCDSTDPKACCSNHVKNPGETDVDCGGSSCPACADGLACLVNSDCASTLCEQDHRCGHAPVIGPIDPVTMEIFDSRSLQLQVSDADGDVVSLSLASSSPAWASLAQQTLLLLPDAEGVFEVGLAASDGRGGTATASVQVTVICAPDGGGACLAPTCGDGKLDGTETDLDCGGKYCAPCELTKHCQASSDCASAACSGNVCVKTDCTDGILDGDETDVDCGGSCPGCAPSQSCLQNSDCLDPKCSNGRCAKPSCTDGRKNGSETDLDCGGAQCPACGDGLGCLRATDCASAVCNNNTCKAASCTDGVRNGTEGDVDCGKDCPNKCATGNSCNVGPDCGTGVCVQGKCIDGTCSDGVRNQGETDVDCGGPCAALTPPRLCQVGQGCEQGPDCVSRVCQPAAGDAGAALVCQAPTCSDDVQNQGETDVDCGGPACPGKCSAGQKCSSGADCISNACALPDGGAQKVCVASACQDGVKDGAETDIDCGGGTCGPCAVGQACKQGSDCTQGVCAGSLCAAPSCSDQVKNGDETDEDCGGSCAGLTPPQLCQPGQGCKSSSDCASGSCDPFGSDVCLAPTCVDGVHNGSETGVDCGGGTCPACGNGKGCKQASDCASGVCAGSVCAAPSCTDGVMNGDETDVDCGGSCSRPCIDGQRCKAAKDCYSGMCGTSVPGACTSACAAKVQTREYLGLGIVGCVGEVTWPQRATLCAPGTTPCEGNQVVARMAAGAAPAYNYWMDEQLGKSTSGSGCQATFGGTTACAADPMHLCPLAKDSAGNACASRGCTFVNDGSNVLKTGMGGCSATAETAGTLCCANRTAEPCTDTNGYPAAPAQVFNSYMAGCHSTQDWSGLGYYVPNPFCAAGCGWCSPTDWVYSRSGAVPQFALWTGPTYQTALGSLGSGSACYATLGVDNCVYTDGEDTEPAPMRVCIPGGGVDPDGNSCAGYVHDCGWNAAQPPDQYFGGCGSPGNAGVLCCCPGFQ